MEHSPHWGNGAGFAGHGGGLPTGVDRGTETVRAADARNA